VHVFKTTGCSLFRRSVPAEIWVKKIILDGNTKQNLGSVSFYNLACKWVILLCLKHFLWLRSHTVTLMSIYSYIQSMCVQTCICVCWFAQNPKASF
jgi:hypothetical protein